MRRKLFLSDCIESRSVAVVAVVVLAMAPSIAELAEYDSSEGPGDLQRLAGPGQADCETAAANHWPSVRAESSASLATAEPGGRLYGRHAVLSAAGFAA